MVTGSDLVESKHAVQLARNYRMSALLASECDLF